MIPRRFWYRRRVVSLTVVIVLFVIIYDILHSDGSGNEHTPADRPPVISGNHAISQKGAKQKNVHISCTLYRKELKLTYRVEPYAFGERNPTSSEDLVSLLTQLSYSRLSMLKIVAEYWSGPISAALYISEEEFRDKSCRQNIVAWLRGTGRTNIAIHLVHENGSLYPVNHLRNIAMDNTQSKYVFMIDVDFIPHKTLFNQLQDVVYSGFFDTEKAALVVPALELLVNTSFPESKQMVLEYFKKEILISFHADKYSPGHNATNIIKWMEASDNYMVKYQFEYEPYILLKRTSSPRYSEQFLDRYWNKASHIFQLDKEGWTFTVLSDSYLVHLPHPVNEKSHTIKRCAEKEWNRFRVIMDAAVQN